MSLHFLEAFTELFNYKAHRQLVEFQRRQLAEAQDKIISLLKEQADAMAVLKPNMPESGLVDACKQVKQVAISAMDNCRESERLISDHTRADKESISLILTHLEAMEIRRVDLAQRFGVIDGK